MNRRMKKKKFKQIRLRNGIEVVSLPFIRQYVMNMEYAHLPYPFYRRPTRRRPLNVIRAERYGYRDVHKLPKKWIEIL